MSGRGLTTAEVEPAEMPRSLVALGLLIFTIAGLLAGMFEILLVPLRIGTTMFPLAVVLAVVSNSVLPRLARQISSDNFGAWSPVIGWTVAVVLLALIPRPEGDVIVPGGSGGDAVVGYTLLIVGFVTGIVTVLRTASVALSDDRQLRRQGRQP